MYLEYTLDAGLYPPACLSSSGDCVKAKSSLAGVITIVGVCASSARRKGCKVWEAECGLAIWLVTDAEGIAMPMVMARSDGETSCVRSSGDGRRPLIRA